MLQHALHRRVFGPFEEFGINDVGLVVLGDQLKQRTQSRTRIFDRFQCAIGILFISFPAIQGRLQQCIA